jgi:hypothetical protein
VSVRDTLIACDTKQNAARTCIRNLDDRGRAPKARLYFVSDNLTQIEKYQERMFPGAPRVQLMVDPEADLGDASGPARLSHLLASTDEHVLSMRDVADRTRIHRTTLPRELNGAAVRAVMRARGWRKVSRKAAGLSGNGFALLRM